MTDADYFSRVERERRAREDALLLLLLALLGRTRAELYRAIRDGLPTDGIVAGVLYEQAARDIARSMSQAYRDGYRRVGLSAGTTSHRAARQDVEHFGDPRSRVVPRVRLNE